SRSSTTSRSATSSRPSRWSRPRRCSTSRPERSPKPGRSVVVGVLQITLLLHGNDSLKGKRSVVKSLIERTTNRFNVSMAEVGSNDDHQRALLGVSAVGNDQSFVNSVLDKVLDAVEDSALGRA